MNVMVPQTATVGRAGSLRRPGWLMIATLGVAVLYVVAAVATMPVERSGDLTAAQMADIRPGWVVMNVLWAAPVLLVAAAYWTVAAALPVSRLATVTRILAVMAAAGAVCYAGLTLSLLSFDAPRLADDARHDTSTLVSLGAYWAAVLATVLVGVALFRSRELRRTGLAVAVIAGLLLVTDVIAYLPGLTGSVPLDEVASFPPMLLALVWLALGIGLVRRRVASVA